MLLTISLSLSTSLAWTLFRAPTFVCPPEILSPAEKKAQNWRLLFLCTHAMITRSANHRISSNFIDLSRLSYSAKRVCFIAVNATVFSRQSAYRTITSVRSDALAFGEKSTVTNCPTGMTHPVLARNTSSPSIPQSLQTYIVSVINYI